MYLIMVIQGFLYWPTSFRIVRAQVLQARENEYIVAARAMGDMSTAVTVFEMKKVMTEVAR